jgi:hypothetical protein
MNKKYIQNINTGKIIEDTGNLGASFRDGSWEELTEQEINDYEFNNKKKEKKEKLKNKKKQEILDELLNNKQEYTDKIQEIDNCLTIEELENLTI